MSQKCFFVLVYFNLVVSLAHGQKNIPLDSSFWATHENTSAVFEEFQNRQTLFLNGRVTLTNFSFFNGTLEVDILANSSRSFAGIFFREQQETAEEVYLRLHKSGQPDAVQYTPVYHGEGSWQLYKEQQVKVTFKEKGWNNLKINVVNNTAKVFVNHVLISEISHLKTGNAVGSIGLWALFGNRFSNLRYTEGFEFTPKFKYPEKLDPTIVSLWEISQPHTYSEKKLLKSFKSETYTDAITEAEGLLPIGKYIKKPSRNNFEKNEEDYVVLRLRIASEIAQTKRFFFDYSDKAIVFLNQEELFRGNNAFRSKGNQFKGHINADANAVSLTLKKGINNLHIVVIEEANGWGFIGRFEDRNGIAIP